jgi:hypothetical protein
MSFLDNVKDKYQDHQEKVAEVKDARGDKLATLPVQYMGGYNDQKKATGSLTFYQKQTEFKAPLLNKKLWFTISNTDVTDVAVEGKDEVNRRVTVTRLLAVGIFAFALKKKSQDKDSFITIVLADGQEAVFHIKDKSPMELKASLAKAISQVKQQGHTAAVPPASSAQGSVADELTKLAKLKEQGVITQDEFDKKKTQLLG